MADLKETIIDGGLQVWQTFGDDANLILTTNDNGEFPGSVPTSIAIGRTDAVEKVHVEGAVKAFDFRIGNRYVGDRLNILENLLPKAPEIEQKTSTSGTNGKLAFGPSNTISGVENVPGVDANQTYNTSGTNRGIIDDSGNVSGTLNSNVSATDEHNANIFSRADEGELELVVNGSVINTADLESTQGAIDSRAVGGTGFNLSSADPLTFPNGEPFEAVKQRSGSWQVNRSDLVSGYNTVFVRHVIDGTTIGSTPEINYVLDNENGTITITGTGFSGLSTSGSLFRSGVEFNTGATAQVDATISGVYPFTYNTGNAISFPTSTNFSISNQSIPAFTTNETDDVVVARTATANSVILNSGFTGRVRVTDTVKSTVTSSPFSAFDLLIDNRTGGTGDLQHSFNTETRRIRSDANFDTGDLVSDWNEEANILTDAGHDDGLQAYNSALVYPSLDFSGIADGPAGNPDYSGATGERTYYGYFTDSSATSNFALSVNGSGTLVSESATFTTGSDQVKLSIKLPEDESFTGGGSGGTAWLDVNEDATPSVDVDGDGAFAAVNGDNKTIGSASDIGITTGTRSTAGSFDKLYFRITVPEGWTGDITNVSINWGV